jgi:hypothetical protein
VIAVLPRCRHRGRDVELGRSSVDRVDLRRWLAASAGL